MCATFFNLKGQFLQEESSTGGPWLMIDWKRSWLLPGKYCISNKAKETHFTILHKIYPVNTNVSLDINSSCPFRKQAAETLVHLNASLQALLVRHRFSFMWFCQCSTFFSLKEIVLYYDNTTNKPLEHTIILFDFIWYIFYSQTKMCK